jgi:hypothetical protein
MNLVVATIPEDSAALAAWLEQRLIGLELARLIDELRAIHAPPADSPPVQTVLAGYLDEIYQRGLYGLPRELLRRLLIQPALLFSLQELVLINGGPYWDALARQNPQLEAIVERGRERLQSVIAPEMTLPLDQPAVGPRKSGARRKWLVGLTAAVVLLAVGWWLTEPLRRPVAWGWARPDALSRQATREEYLRTLADEAGEWFNKRPRTTKELARRIEQFRQGCSALIQSDHRPLPESDRRWLVERCRKWSSKFDQSLMDLESGKDMQTVLAQMDATVNQLIDLLRQRARQPT